MNPLKSLKPVFTHTSFSTVLNKYKRRKFLKTKNLLTGETEADPEMIKVNIKMHIHQVDNTKI